VDWLAPWSSYRTEIEDCIDAGEGRVVVLTRDYACPLGAEAEVDFIGGPVWTVRDGKVARIEFYWNRAEGLAAGAPAADGLPSFRRGAPFVVDTVRACSRGS